MYITYSTGSGMLMRYMYCFNMMYVQVPVYISLKQCANLRHCTHLVGIQKSVKSADFFDTVILSLFSRTASKFTIVGLNFNSSKVV